MKRKTFLFLLVISLVWAASMAYCVVATAATVTAQSAWTYNGMESEGGFTIEKQLPGTTEWIKIIDITNINTRSYTFVFEALAGRTLFRQRVFSGDKLGPWSALAAYEYMEGGDPLKTTFFLQYTIKP